MNVFILSTGRSGSSAISKACNHIDNFTSGHETLSREFGEKRFNYPDNHIESDNRLSWHLGKLDQLYSEKNLYIHLMRNRDKVAQSFMSRFYIGNIMDSFCSGIRMTPAEKMSEKERLQACYDYVDTVNTNIKHFMSDKDNIMSIDIENIEEGFKEMWIKIGAKGNLEKALTEFSKKHNSSTKRKFNFTLRLKSLVIKEYRHIKMCLQK